MPGPGTVLYNFGGDWNTTYTVLLLASGKLLLAGSAASVNGTASFVRLQADGTLDPTFADDGLALTSAGDNTVLYSGALCPDGKLAGAGADGTFTNFLVVRASASGLPDASFGTDGVVITSVASNYGYAQSLVVQPDGKIVVAGFASDNGTDYTWVVIRYNVDGSLDSSFGVAGKATITWTSGDNEAYGIALLASGKLVVTGYAFDAGLGYSVVAVVQLLANGTLDPAFGTSGKVTTNLGAGGDAIAGSVVVQPDGKIIWAGEQRAPGATARRAVLVRYNTDGSLDTTFSTDGIVIQVLGLHDELLSRPALQPDGKIVVAGTSVPSGSNHNYLLARFNTNGTLDTTFATVGYVLLDWGALSDGHAYGLALLPDGQIIQGGSIAAGMALARYSSSGVLDLTFGENMASAPLIDHSGAKVNLNMAPSLSSFSSDLYAVSGGGAACAVTADADAARPNILRQIHCSYSAAPTGGGVKVEDGSGTTVFQMDITAAGEHVFDFPDPRAGTKNTAMIVTLLAPGGAVVGRLFADIYRHK